MPSIRKFLLINLLLTITLTTYVTIVGNYYLDQKEIQNHLDLLLSQYAYSLQAIFSNSTVEHQFKNIQKNLDTIPEQAKDYINIEKSNYQIQVWDDKGDLLLHSVNAPNLPITSQHQGFSDAHIDGKSWRVFTLHDAKMKITLAVTEGFDIRNDLARRITRDDIYLMLIIYPLCGLLIWIIIGRGLSVVKRIANEVANRAHNRLEPVNFDSIPAEIKPLIDELNRLFLRLQLALEREKRFAGDAAHELRTPLAALKTQSQVAMTATEMHEMQSVLQNMIAGVDRCTHVVQQLLTLSRLAPDAETINDTMEVNLVKLSQEIIAQIVPQAIEKNIEIEFDSAQDNIFVMGNGTALGILMRNLVDNAIRYTPADGFVKVFIENENDKVVLKVVDSGPGIPPELRARVFERFFRILGNTAPGSGLGLAIVQQIVRLHKAEIFLLTPASGNGLEVRVLFPAL